MKFSVFVFSLCVGNILSYFLQINEKLGIQIWHVPENIEKTKEIPLEDFYMRRTETYIILEKTLENNYSLFYWVGSQSNLTKRKNVTHNVALLQVYLQEIQNGWRLIFFDREMEGLESEKFCNLFRLSERPEVTNLYNVRGSQGHLISLSPISGNTFYITDTLVLHKGREVIIWSGQYAFPVKVNAARLLAERIVKVDLQKQDEEINQHIIFIDDLLTEKGYKTFNEHFPNYIDQSILKPNHFSDKPYTSSDQETKKYINGILEAYVFSINKCDDVRVKLIEQRPLSLQLFKKSKTYILKLFTSGHTFIYLGKEAPAALIQYTLYFAEVIVFPEQGKWRNITIIREGELLPTPFIIHFYDELIKLLSLSNSSKIDGSWSQKAENAETH